jgi:uncharacterized protein
MNWLLISDDTEKSKRLSVCLRSCDPNIAVNAYLMSDGKKEAFDDSLLKKVSQCILLSDNPERFPEQTIYIKGFCVGRNIPLYCAGTGTAQWCGKKSGVYFFPDLGNLESYIRKEYSALKRVHDSREAYCYLFAHGIPFTPDSFARFIAKDNRTTCSKYITAGMDVNSRTTEGVPMLNIAARNDQKDCAGWLLEIGADINAVSADRGYTAVMDAVWRGNKDITELLVNKGAALNIVNKEGQTMLILAVGAGRKDICLLLAEHGESPDIKDSMGMSAYGYAKLFRRDDIVQVLEKYHKE